MKKILLTTVISGFLFISVPALATDYSQKQNKADDKMNSPKPETYEKQKVQKLEKDEGRYQQLKKDADPRGRTEENKGNFDTEIPHGTGVQ